jgi:hypothetical protein
MEPTCLKEKCKQWDKGKCPMFVESWWIPAMGGEPKLIGDCSPKRIFLMIQELQNRLTGIEKTQEQLRDETIWVQVIAEILGRSVGIDLEVFVKEREKLQNIQKIKELSTTIEIQKP